MDIFLHDGALDELPGIFARESFQRVFFVVDETALEACGARAKLENTFAQCDVERFTDFELNPKLADVERGVKLASGFEPEVVVALGGGTALDLGKLIGSLAESDGSPVDVITGQAVLQGNGVPLVAIPTTSGTGSEATHFAVAYVGDKKFSVAHASLLPKYALVDPELTHSLPAAITAATGLDAFCQAIESIWSVGANEESLSYAEEAASLALQHLVTAVNQPSPQSRSAMSRASHLAGKAINISKTTAPHALSYALTSRHQIPHGVAVALTLGPMLVFNAALTDSDCVDPRGAQHVRMRIAKVLDLFGVKAATEACAAFQELLSAIHCPTTVAEAGIHAEAELSQIVGSVNVERLANNPRRASSETLRSALTASRSLRKFDAR